MLPTSTCRWMSTRTPDFVTTHRFDFPRNSPPVMVPSGCALWATGALIELGSALACAPFDPDPQPASSKQATETADKITPMKARLLLVGSRSARVFMLCILFSSCGFLCGHEPM